MGDFLIDLLPTAGLTWALTALGVSAALIVALALLERAAAAGHHVLGTIIAGGTVAALALFNVMVLVRGRDMLITGWFSAITVVAVVWGIAGAVAYFALTEGEELDEATTATLLVSGGLCSLSIVLWVIDLAVDAIDKRLQPVGLGGSVVLLVAFGLWLASESSKKTS